MKEQLYQKHNGEYSKIFPLNYIQNLIDSKSGNTLTSILQAFNNIYIPYQGNPQDTRNIIPESLRRKGLWITYNNGEEYITEYYKGDANDIQEYWTEDYNWEIIPNLKYVQDNASKLPDGIITADKLSPALLQLIQSSGKVVNMADDEDIEEVNSTLKFKDRKYNSELASGKGYKIFRKNWTRIGSKMINLLTQDMINKSNTVYEIRYDFDLNEKEINIPEGCILKFNGGSINNGRIIYSDTLIIGFNKSYTNIICSGNLKNSIIYVDYYGAIQSTTEDSSDAIYNAFKYNNVVHLYSGADYSISKSIDIDASKNLFGNGATIHIYNSFTEGIDTSTKQSYIFKIGNEDIIKNDRIYFGNFTINIEVDPQKRQLYAFNLIGQYGRTYEQIRIIGAKGIAIIGNNCFSIVFDNCVFHSYHNSDGTNNYIGIYSSVYGINKGERISIINTNISGFRTIILASHISSFFIINSSLDYFDQIISVGNKDGTNLSINNCHIEADMNGLNWFYSIGENNQSLIVSNCFMTLATERISEYMINWKGYVFLDNIRFAGTYSKESLSTNSNVIKSDFIHNVSGATPPIIPNSNIIQNGVPINNVISDFAIESYHSEEGQETGTVTIDSINNELVYNFYNRFTGYGGLSMIIPQGIRHFKVTFEAKKTSTDSGKLAVILVAIGKNNKRVGFSRRYIEVTNEFNTYEAYFDVNNYAGVNKLYIENEGPNTHNYYIKNIKLLSIFGEPYTPMNNRISDRKYGELKYLPASPIIGQGYFSTENNIPLFFNGTQWVTSDGNPNINRSGTFESKPTSEQGIKVGFAYFCTNRQTSEGSTNGIMIYYKGDNIWVDALGRVVE